MFFVSGIYVSGPVVESCKYSGRKALSGVQTARERHYIGYTVVVLLR